MSFEIIKEYYRQKRIRRILNFYSHLQPTVFTSEKGRKPVLISRDAKIHFILLLFSFFFAAVIVNFFFSSLMNMAAANPRLIIRILGMLPGVVFSFLAVELSDYLLQKLTGFFDALFDYFIPIALVVIALFIVVGVKYFNKSEEWRQGLSDWRKQVDNNIQSKPIDIQLNPVVGSNWFFALNDKSQLLKLTRDEAQSFCSKKGVGWGLFEPNSNFVPNPQVQFNRSFTVWLEKGGFPAGQLDPKMGIAKPSVFSSSSTPEDKNAVLCILKMVGG